MEIITLSSYVSFVKTYIKVILLQPKMLLCAFFSSCSLKTTSPLKRVIPLIICHHWLTTMEMWTRVMGVFTISMDQPLFTLQSQVVCISQQVPWCLLLKSNTVKQSFTGYSTQLCMYQPNHMQVLVFIQDTVLLHCVFSWCLEDE